MALEHPIFHELELASRRGDKHTLARVLDYLKRQPELIDSDEEFDQLVSRSLHIASRRLPSSVLRSIERELLEFKSRQREAGLAAAQEQRTADTLARVRGISKTESAKVTVFLGAGASKPKPSNIPTVTELLPELWKKAEKLETRPLKKLQNWCAESEITNIEDLLTALTISHMVVKNPRVHSLFDSILYTSLDDRPTSGIRDTDTISSLQESTNTFFSLLVGTMLDAKPNAIHRETVAAIKNLNKVQVVTTNYDACLEQALDEQSVKYSYIIDKKAQSCLQLIKMHGSINWYYCDVCQHIMMPDIAEMKKARKNKLPYPLLGMCSKCNSTAKQFIVPPTSYKYVLYPPIVEVWDACRTAFDESDVIIVVGYSFGDADDYIAKMLLKSVSEHPEKKIIICDLSEDVTTRVKQALMNHATDFKPDDNYFPLVGKAEDLYVKALEALVSSRKAKKTAKRPSKATTKKTTRKTIKKIVKK